ncbi:MAG: polysaccharide deacetylase family protein [Candidatus Omnitrophica bacterium]|nr:polysaccharide deacetylase family protein [Candidatus Omnitrophota bacterium]MDD5592418.1 polysaccharide deacetylase family protein [Candidatus Omnitrophota bacterium]
MPRYKRVVIIVLGLIFALIISGAVFIRQHYVVPILMYHSVAPEANPENRICVSAQTFQRQMRFLKSRHYHVLPLEEIAALIKEKKRLPPRTVAITFDDGYKDTYLYAFPVLRKYNFPATMFIIINEVGRMQDDRLSWEQIKIMQDSGLINFGSHALGPGLLVEIKSDGELKREIFDSKKILEQKLGRQVLAFSYPEGRFNDKIKELVAEAGYKFAVVTNPGKDSADDDIFALKRLRISENCRNLFVFWVETSGFYNFMREHRHR